MPHGDESVREAHLLSQLLIQITEQFKADFGSIAASLGLPVHLARAVVMLDNPSPMRDLADRLTCDRSHITGIADQLEERGLVERIPGEDRRVKLLCLTASGRNTRQRISQAVADRALVLRRLDEAQRSTLLSLLQALSGDPEIRTADLDE